jgi:hypothetical protein
MDVATQVRRPVGGVQGAGTPPRLRDHNGGGHCRDDAVAQQKSSWFGDGVRTQLADQRPAVLEDAVEQPVVDAWTDMVQSTGEHRDRSAASSSGCIVEALPHGLDRAPVHGRIRAHRASGDDEMARVGRGSSQFPGHFAAVVVAPA